MYFMKQINQIFLKLLNNPNTTIPIEEEGLHISVWNTIFAVHKFWKQLYC